jgi:succinoglycan biosynthesis transport protein ExoP
MKLTNYIAPLIKWWWLIVLSSIVAGIPAYLITRPQPPVYMARTTLIVGRAISDPNPTGNEFELTQQLAQSYTSIAKREPVRDATMKALGLQQLPTYSAHVVPNSPFIEILVNDIDPTRAQIVANELANQLILQSPTTPERQEQERLRFISQQLDGMQQEITKTQDDITQKQQALANMTSAIQISELSNEIQGLETKLALLQTNYATLISSTQSGAINTLSVMEPATLPTQPIGPKKTLIILLAAIGGFIFATGAAYLIEFLDRSLKTPEQINSLVQLPVIGYIGNAGRDGWKHVIEKPRSPVSEAFRSLRTNMEFSGVDEPLKTILITSTDTGDGKTLVATNLALVLSQTEKKVILVDCDLRKPHVHRALGIKSKPGLSEAFREHSPILDVIQNVNGQKLAVIPAGSIPPNPAELLGSRRMKQILGALSEKYDAIIMDCAPLVTTDALVLSTQVDSVILVTHYAHTMENALQAAVDQLKRANAHLGGVILNQISRTNSLAYRYYSNGYYGWADESQAKQVDKLNGNLIKRKLISGITIIQNLFHRKRKDSDIDLAEDSLFAKIVPGHELENPIKPFDEVKENITGATTDVSHTTTAGES